MKYWTPLQRLHQMNEYFAMLGEYRNFGFWLKFSQLFFDPTPQDDPSSVALMNVMRIIAADGETFDVPLISLGRLFYLWALEGATQFRWQVDSVQEQMSPLALQLECQLTWSTDYDNGLSIGRQSGPCRITFRNSPAALVSGLEWRIVDWRLFYSQDISELVINNGKEKVIYGFPPSVAAFMTQCSVTAGGLLVRELGGLVMCAKSTSNCPSTNENSLKCEN